MKNKNNISSKIRIFRICAIVAIIIFVVSLFYFYLINPKVPSRESMTCSSDDKQCVFVVTGNGGATTSYYNRVYSYNTETSSKELLFAVDKASPSQIKLEWNSSQNVSVIVPSCSLVERRSNPSYLTIIFQENSGSGVVDCNF